MTMERARAADALLTLYVQRGGAGGLQGRIRSDYFDRELPFADCFAMLKAMDQLYDTLCFPQSTFAPRRFQDRAAGHSTQKEMTPPMVEENSQATFVVQVKFRRNATWQGTIRWVEQNQSRNFRSTLELIRLIDESLSDGQTPEIRWDC